MCSSNRGFRLDQIEKDHVQPMRDFLRDIIADDTRIPKTGGTPDLRRVSRIFSENKSATTRTNLSLAIDRVRASHYRS